MAYIVMALYLSKVFQGIVSIAPADLDGTGNIGAPDLLLILAEFGCLENCGIADIDGNDQVDVGDALLFLADYGMPCE